MTNVESGGVPSLRPWYSSPRFGTPALGQSKDSDPVNSAKQPAFLEKGDPELAQLLKNALDDLDVVKGATAILEPRIADALQGAYEKIQCARSKVQTPQPQVTAAPATDSDATSEQQQGSEAIEEKDDSPLPEEPRAELPEEKQSPTEDSATPTQGPLISKVSEGPGIVKTAEAPSVAFLPPRPATSSSGVRAPLADSEFSWMLGEHTHRSTFVSSASLPPDQRRHSKSRSKSPLFGDARDQAREGCTDDEDGLSLNSFT
jgi:TBC1 domain family protein 5